MRKLFIVPLAAVILVGCTPAIESTETSTQAPSPSPKVQTEISAEVKAKLKEQALAYLQTQRNLKNRELMDLDLDHGWYLAHEPAYSTNQAGNYVVGWTGRRGCEHDPSQPGGPDNGPNYFDETGKRCYLLDYVEVSLDLEFTPLRLYISEVGGII